MFLSGAGNEEDQDFVPTARGTSKLASLFGTDKASTQGNKESFKYQAPKEPRRTPDPEPGGETKGQGAPTVLHAVPATAYKLVEGKYTSQGKLGLAVIGSHATTEYNILLYVSKQQQVTNARISSTFSFMVQPNNYVNFYDDAQQNWSLLFDTEAQIMEFGKQVALAKANSCGNSLDATVTQDLKLGEGVGLESGDGVELRYTGWLLEQCILGQQFDGNVGADRLLRLKVGRGKVVKGLDEGLLGMKRGGRRLVIVPPPLGYGSEGKNKVPSGATLVYDVEAVRTKCAKKKKVPTATLR